MKKCFIAVLSAQFILVSSLSAYDLQAHVYLMKGANAVWRLSVM
jgi:hypothetical protein